MKKFVFLAIIFTILAFAAITLSQDSRAEIRKLNADDAEALQKKFESFTPDTPCKPDDIACIGGAFAKCAVVAGGKAKYQLQPCAGGLKCFALPLVNKRGTSLTCTTQEDRDARMEQARKNLKRRNHFKRYVQ